MSELGNTLKSLRGKATQQLIADKTGITARTIQRVEKGERLQLATLRKLAQYFRLNRSEWAHLLIAWLRLELSEDFDLLAVAARHLNTDGKTAFLSDSEKFVELYRSIPAKHQRQLALAMEREEVLKSIAPLNDLFDSLRAPKRR